MSDSLWAVEFSRLSVAFPFSRGFFQPRDQIQVSRIAGRFFTSWATREALGDPKIVSEKTNKLEYPFFKKKEIKLEDTVYLISRSTGKLQKSRYCGVGENKDLESRVESTEIDPHKSGQLDFWQRHKESLVKKG